MAIDREGMNKALGFGVGAPHYYLDWAVGSLGYDESVVKNEYNPAKAKELLAAAGHPNGVHIELKVIAREPENTIGEFAQQMWTRAGFQTKLVSMERLAWIDEVRAKKFQACFWRGTFTTAVDPDTLSAAHPERRHLELVPVRRQGDRPPDGRGRPGARPEEAARDLQAGVLTRLQEQAYLATGIAMPLLMARRKEVMGLTYNYQMPNLDRVWLNK